MTLTSTANAAPSHISTAPGSQDPDELIAARYRDGLAATGPWNAVFTTILSHRSVRATLIDSATGCAGYSLIPAGGGFRTIETKVNLSRTITSDTGRVRAEARVVSQTRQIISAEARVTARDGRILAHGSRR